MGPLKRCASGSEALRRSIGGHWSNSYFSGSKLGGTFIFTHACFVRKDHLTNTWSPRSLQTYFCVLWKVRSSFWTNVSYLEFQATVYKTGSACVAFLANVDTQSDKTVNFNGNSYHLPAWSVSILPDCKNVVLNTAKVCLMIFHGIFMPFNCSRFPLFLEGAHNIRIYLLKMWIMISFSKLDFSFQDKNFHTQSYWLIY